jgi:hypothetical protein
MTMGLIARSAVAAMGLWLALTTALAAGRNYTLAIAAPEPGAALLGCGEPWSVAGHRAASPAEGIGGAHVRDFLGGLPGTRTQNQRVKRASNTASLRLLPCEARQAAAPGGIRDGPTALAG